MVHLVLYSSVIPLTADIDPSVVFAHKGLGVVIGHDTVIGPRTKILHHVTIGGRSGIRANPVIGSDVLVGAGAMILGDVVVGDRCDRRGRLNRVAQRPGGRHGCRQPRGGETRGGQVNGV